ncbi:patatin-like phospholipase family protein [Maribacter sp. 1_MG-2023]|nr:patatin-like phospholipase family protein [Maribacter sp. 1_MG-2023]MDO6472732.1 patatin-like phospholipase family protein [Maribacter sp. 1_MG-2023]
MKKIITLILLVINLGVTSILIAQNKKPKIALVLSGGGAKGVAHIPVLQALDSLHIVPDIIVGTSMGSVVGVIPT